MLSDKTYHFVKWTTAIALPAFVTFLLSLDVIWGFGISDKLIATFSALNVLLGAILGVSTRQYNKTATEYDGVLYTVGEGENKQALLYSKGLDDIAGKSELRFKLEENSQKNIGF